MPLRGMFRGPRESRGAFRGSEGSISTLRESHGVMGFVWLVSWWFIRHMCLYIRFLSMVTTKWCAKCNSFRKQIACLVFRQLDTSDAIDRLRMWQINLLNTMILHSNIPEITPKRLQITPDHTRSSQEHAFWTYFLTGPRHTSNGLFVRFKSEKKHTSGHS